MAITNQYRQVLSKILNKEIDFNSDTIYAALVAAAYTPNYDTHAYWSDVVANEVTGTGYTANGQLLSSCTITYTAANSWATTWAASTAYALNDVVRPTAGNGFLYRAKAAGTSSGAQPTWPTTVGGEVTDGGVTWECVGAGVTVIASANPSWASSTITARYCVIYDRTPATDATRPLICCIDQGAAVSSTAGPFTVTINAQGLIMFFPYQ
jgi:hypothetical protein